MPLHPRFVAICALALTLLAGAWPHAAQADSGDRPNFLIVIADDLHRDTLGFMGDPIIQTPNIDALAAEGVTFENAFVTTATCRTSRAALMTGQYAARTGLYFTQFKELSEEVQAMTFPHRLNEAGYHTGYVGKWHLGSASENLFDDDRAMAGQGRFWDGKNPPESGRHLTGRLGDQAVDTIRDAPDDQPFAITVGFKAPHVQDGFHPTEPYPASPSTAVLYETDEMPAPPLSDPEFFANQPEVIRTSLGRERWEYRLGTPKSLNFQRSMRRYYRMVTGIDQQVGRIMKTLRETGRLDNTVVIVTSDHGMYLGRRGLAGKWLGHETSIRIPMVVYDPRLPESERGTRRDEMALLFDLHPTLLDWAEAEASDQVQGRSLAPIVAGETPSDWRNEFFYEHHSFPNRIPRNEGVRTERYKYLRYLDSEPTVEELYDLEADPREAENLADDPEHRDTLKAMRAKWRQWRQQVR